MFQQTFVPDSNRTRGGASLLLSFGVQVMVIVVLILIPLIYTQALPARALPTVLTAPPPPAPPPPPPPVQAMARRMPPRIFDGFLHAPARIPDRVAPIIDTELPQVQNVFVVAAVPGGTPRSTFSVVAVAPAPPAAPPVVRDVPKKPIQRVTVGGQVIAASLIKRVVPQYPPLARQARVQGTVQFTAIIGRDGMIQNLQLISGHPLLVPAARDAIRQWVYKPTILNTEPVEVITQIEFTFTLNQ